MLPGSQDKEQRDIAYWMGKVDTQLATIMSTLEKLASADRTNWREFRDWRTEVDARLATGSENFVKINADVSSLKNDVGEVKRDYDELKKDIKDCQAGRLNVLEQLNGQAKQEKKEDSTGVLSKPISESSNITYRWLIEKILLPVLLGLSMGFTTWLFLTLIPDILKHMAIP